MNLKRSLLGMAICCLPISLLHAQSLLSANRVDSVAPYTKELTYVNPVLPGDHPDPTLLKVGDDFYHCGSSFHFNPYLPIYHSRDLVHWKVIGRVLPPSHSAMVADRPSGGIWQGAITYFYGSYWIYFSAGGQWFCKAASPIGPWSVPVQVKTDSATGLLGYDNSIFVDDDGKPYMVIKNGQKVNRLRALNHDGQLTDTVINLDWINANLQYSWAEGPVMCKRNGYYYYFPAGDVSGGQYVLRTKILTADSTKWERLGNFFKPGTDPQNVFKVPNHIAAPVQLADGSWWTLGQSYEKTETDDWSGMGRQTGLYQVVWENDRPWGMPPVSTPVVKPALAQEGISWRTGYSDYFDDSASLAPNWHFLNKTSAANYSLADRQGWIRLYPGQAKTHLLQKETEHYYTIITRLDFDATDSSHQAGLYLTNGNQQVFIACYTGYENGKKIIFQHDTTMCMIPNKAGKELWLMLERDGHLLTASYSHNRDHWIRVGTINSQQLDGVQPNFNSWVGTSIGLFAKGKPADFDCFVYKDGRSHLPAVSHNNFYGIETATTAYGKLVTNISSYGGWLMFAGVDLGTISSPSGKMKITLEATKGAGLEVMLDSLSATPLATVAIVPTQGKLKKINININRSSGQHDVFIRFTPGNKRAVFIRSISFSSN